MTAWTYGAWAFAAGVLIPVMAILNGGLGRAIGSSSWAAVVLFAVALAAALAVAALSPGGRPALGALANGRPWQFAAGLIVLFYVLSATYLTPRFGVAPTILLVVVAQIITASLISHFGWLEAPRQPMDGLKAVGLALMVAGVVLTQVRRA